MATGRVGAGPRAPTGPAVLSAALTYGLLAGFVATAYVVVLLLGGVRAGHPGPVWLHALGVVIALATAEPVRRWLVRATDEIVFGQHADPYDVLLDLTRETDDHAAGPASLATTIARAVRLPYVSVEFADGSGAAFGEPVPAAPTARVPLVYKDDLVGEMVAGGRRPGSDLLADDVRLLRDLADQAAISAYAQRAAEEIARSRAELVSAREEERRRIRRDLHDGLGPTLASVRLQLAAVRSLLRDQPDRAEEVLDELSAALRDTTAQIRVLVYGLRPPMLDDLGLVGALRNLITGPGPVLVVAAPDPLPTLPAAVEVAVYRIAAEAVQNALRHAAATTVRITLTVDDLGVALEVEDDGRGLPDSLVPGVGIHAMHERVEEVAGRLEIASATLGTRVSVRIPLGGADRG